MMISSAMNHGDCIMHFGTVTIHLQVSDKLMLLKPLLGTSAPTTQALLCLDLITFRQFGTLIKYSGMVKGSCQEVVPTFIKRTGLILITKCRLWSLNKSLSIIQMHAGGNLEQTLDGSTLWFRIKLFWSLNLKTPKWFCHPGSIPQKSLTPMF